MASDAPTAERSAADRLLDATLESIHLHGLAQTTVSTVTDLAGLSRGMVRHEFGSKQAMVVAAMRRLCETWLAATDPDPDLAGPDQVRSIVAAMFAPEAFTPVQIDAWLVLSVEGGADPELGELRAATQQRWIDQLCAAYERSGVSDPHEAAVSTLATADGLWLQHRGSAGGDPGAVVLRVVEALLAT